MSELKKLVAQYKKSEATQGKIRQSFKTLLNNKSLSFDARLKLWMESPNYLKTHYAKRPATPNKMIRGVLQEIADQLLHAGSKIELSTGLMDDLYIYEHDEFEEAMDSASHLKTKKDFITFMEYVFKHNLGSYNY